MTPPPLAIQRKMSLSSAIVMMTSAGSVNLIDGGAFFPIESDLALSQQAHVTASHSTNARLRRTR